MPRSLQFTEPGVVEIVERDPLEPGPGDVLVETEVSAISPGTERLVYRGETPEIISTDEAVPAFVEEFSYPMQYGYAAVGRVSGVGEGVEESWLGRRVFAYNPHESEFIADIEDVVPVPPGVKPRRGALLASAETAVTFALDGRPVLDERVAVFGAGVVGLLTTGVLADFPLDRLTVIEPVERRRDLARAFGAEAIPPEEYGQLTDRRPELVFELSGDPSALDDALDIAAYDGRIVVGSWYGEKPATLALGGRFHRNRVAVTGSQVSTIAPELAGRWSRDRRHEVAWDWLDRLPVEELFTQELPLEEAPRAFELLENRPGEAIQVLLTY